MKSTIIAAALCIAFCEVALPLKAHSASVLTCNDFKKMGAVVPGVSRPVLDQGADGVYRIIYYVQGHAQPTYVRLAKTSKVGNQVNFSGLEEDRSARVNIRVDSEGNPSTAAIYAADSIAQCAR